MKIVIPVGWIAGLALILALIPGEPATAGHTEVVCVNDEQCPGTCGPLEVVGTYAECNPLGFMCDSTDGFWCSLHCSDENLLQGKCEVILCEDDDPCRGHFCVGGVCGECRQDSHCDAGTICVSGACVAADCQTDDDCERGEDCVRTANAQSCAPHEGPCATDQDCPEGFTCGAIQLGAGGAPIAVCLNLPVNLVECRGARDCGRGEACIEGRCATLMRPCMPNPACPTTYKCSSGSSMGLCPKP